MFEPHWNMKDQILFTNEMTNKINDKQLQKGRIKTNKKTKIIKTELAL